MGEQQTNQNPVQLGFSREEELDSFAAQYRSSYAKLRLVAMGMIGDQNFAEDIVQDAAIIAWRKWDDFVPGTNFAAWMSTIVRNCANNHLRKVRNRKTAPADPRILEQELPSSANRSESTLASNPLESLPGDRDSTSQEDFDDRVQRSLNLLSSEARSCLLLRVVHQLSYAEISELLEIPAGTAMSHVHRSKVALRKSLRHETDKSH